MKNIPALIITYNPAQDLADHLDVLYEQFDQIILVDNGSRAETVNVIEEQVRLRGAKLNAILNHQNLGVAAALNQGFSVSSQLGYDYIVTLDQDSLPAPGMVKAMCCVLDAHSGQDTIAIIAPVVEDPQAGIVAPYIRARNHFLFERKNCTGQLLENVSMVITSGSMYNLKICQQIGSFREEFFIDYVDTEYCFRARKKGFNIIVACDARLHHKLGAQQKVRIGALEMRPTFHSVVRWYYIGRNRMPMVREYGLFFPHWLLYEFIINSYGFLRMLLLEDNKLGKILATFLGCLDGLAGRMGAIPDARRDLLLKFEQAHIP